MYNLLLKMESELNSIAEKKSAVLADVTITSKSKYIQITELDMRHATLRQLMQSYISLQLKFTELIGGYNINY